jgi:hypothetical protein
MTYVLSDKTFDAIETIQLEAHNKIIEAVAKDLCQKRVSKPIGDKSIGYVVYLDDNGPYHIEGIIYYVDSDEKGETVCAEIYDDDMKESFEAVVMAKI